MHNSLRVDKILRTSLMAESMSLGPHWIYDQQKIIDLYGTGQGLLSLQPPAATYHVNKFAGDFTAYGDVTMILVRNIAKHNGILNLESYSADWRAFWENPATTSYKDGASKTTHANLQQGKSFTEAGTDSHDFSPVGRAAALFSAKWESPKNLIDTARQLTSMTHNSPAVIEATEFFTRVVLAGITDGSGVIDAINSAA